MTIAGVPVVVDEDGVTVDSTTTPVDPIAVATVNSVLTNLGMTIALSSPSTSRDGGTITYDAGSLIVLWNPPGSANKLAAFVGGARVVAGAVPGRQRRRHRHPARGDARPVRHRCP